MDERALRVLEFDKIRARLVELASYPPSKEWADGLRPFRDREEIQRRQDETVQLADLLDRGLDIHLSHLSDIRELIRRAGAGSMLEEEDLADIAHTSVEARRLRRVILQSDAAGGLVREQVAGLPDLQAVDHAILSRLTDDRKLRDDASPRLQGIRRQLRAAQNRLRADLDDWVRRGAQQGLLQEASFTVRNGRFVLPVRHDRRDRIPGIVHDRSATGQTLFIEPMALVEMGNRIRELEAEEEAERRRILTLLTESVGERHGDFLAVVNVLTWLDFTAARVRLGRRYGGIRPEETQDGELILRSARHPLLIDEQLAGRLERVVPLDLHCEADLRALLITGPNTGGKTVALKTVGLCVLMYQAGLPVPVAHGSRLPVFRQVFADIGDEQSIEQSLSTFSSHMAHIVSILQRADGESLILLDELGAGTDPEEGAALAMAVLEALVDRGAKVLATTHYGQLKSFVHRRPGMANASVEFDFRTLAPTYRLHMGLPGRSNALEIARRLGLPAPLVEQARSYMGQQRVEFEALLAEAEGQRRLASEEREKAELARQQAEATRRELERSKEALEMQRKQWLEEARSEARETVRAARREAEQWIAKLRKMGRQAELEEARRARAQLEARQGELERKIDESESSLAAAPPEAAARQGARRSAERDAVVKPGSRVWVVSLGQEAEVVEGPNAAGEVVVQVGPMRMVVEVSGVRPMGRVGGGKARGETLAHPDGRGASGRASGGTYPKAVDVASVPRELHLRGMTVDEALPELEKFLDRARWAGLSEVRIVHGKGTGILREAVANYLRMLPFVRSYSVAPPNEGGHGVTIATLD